MLNLASQRQRSVEIKKRGAFSHRSIPTLIRKKSEAEADAFFRKLSTENLKKLKETNTNTLQNGETCENRSPLKRSNRSRRNLNELSNDLYQEHFEREHRRQAR